MKKNVLFILSFFVAFCGVQDIKACAYVKHLFRRDGVGLMDWVISSAVQVAIILAHEYGHAYVAKKINNLGELPILHLTGPLKLTTPLKLGRLRIHSPLPDSGFTTRPRPFFFNWTRPAKRAEFYINIAGNVFGSVASLVAFGFFQKVMPRFNVTKMIACHCLYDQTLGLNGWQGRNIPGLDPYKIKRSLTYPSWKDILFNRP